MLADRMSRVSTSPTMKVAGEAEKLKREGVDVVDFGAGEPDFPTPEPAKTAAKVAIDQNFTKYTPPAGTSDLKQAICARYKTDYGVSFSEAETIATAGGKQALFNIAMVLFNPGDEVITHAPYWPTIPEQIKLMEATPVIVHTKPEDGFAIHPEAILAAITPKTKAIIINSPANPTGAVISEQDMAAIADVAGKRGIWVIVDLCYEKLIYDSVPHNLVKVLTDRMRDRTLIAGSASKTYSMTGWRCGWILGPKEIVAAANTLQGHSTSNVASISQKAAQQALTGSQEPVTAMLNEYRIRRDKLLEMFAVDPRFECVKPAGAFYLFPRVTKVLESTGISSTGEFSQMLLDEARVALTAGEGFDAPGFVRISYATSLDRLREGTTRILEFVKKRERQGAAVR
ncbi:MAG: pyridoxal phosphate-dependent aminotransferase [Acidobacteria bacterium]|nr:pyridoxal phosphate-dependent aminotransferase [Acidobacteriota bacterium]